MIHCPSCQQLATKRDGYDEQGRQRYGCRPCHRDFAATSTSAFAGYRWPADVIPTAVRWYASYPLSATHVMQLLAERHVNVSARTVLNWVQTFGPQLTKVLHGYRRRLGRRWHVDEVFYFRGKQKTFPLSCRRPAWASRRYFAAGQTGPCECGSLFPSRPGSNRDEPRRKPGQE